MTDLKTNSKDSLTSSAGTGSNVGNSRPIGSAIQIAKVDQNRNFQLDLDALSDILLRDNIRDKPVVIISIAGDLRKGKSFLLNFFLRYLHSRGSKDWLGAPDSPLIGFHWRGGAERDTTGIVLWSEPFVIKTRGNQEVAVLLMDTQGCFDSEHTVRETAIVFALSVMTSSIMIYNLMHNIQEDNLQVLQMFTEYGKLALDSSHVKPFQRLVFLIRDWSYPYEYPYGLKGGQNLLNKYLAIDERRQDLSMQRLRRLIRDCFQDIKCYLMPYPGTKVATNPTFDGRIADIDSEFVKHLKAFVPLMLKNVVIKEIGGQKVNGRQLLEYFKAYVKVFTDDSMPEPKTMLDATAEVNNLSALAVSKDKYNEGMELICGGDRAYVRTTELELRHEILKEEIIKYFDGIPKLGGNEFSDPYRQELTNDLDHMFEHFRAQNDSKDWLRFIRTPSLLLVSSVLLFIIWRICLLFGLSPIAQLAFIMGSVCFGLFIVYMSCWQIGIHLNRISYIIICLSMATIALLVLYFNQK